MCIQGKNYAGFNEEKTAIASYRIIHVRNVAHYVGIDCIRMKDGRVPMIIQYIIFLFYKKCKPQKNTIEKITLVVVNIIQSVKAVFA